MNELYATINFSKQKFILNGVDLISGDYNSTKIKFTFEDNQDKTKVIEIRPANSEDKNPTFMANIINNEVILTSKDDNDHNVTPFTTGGVYYMEISAYSEDSKLSTITKSFNVLEEQIILSDEIVSPYLPVFDELIEEIIRVTDEASNVNIDVTKNNNITTVTITNRNGVVKTVQILDGKDGEDGEDGVGIESIEKISTSGLVDTYRITLTNNEHYDYEITNGNGIVSIEKTGTSGNIDTYTITYSNGTTSTFTVTNSEVTEEEFEELQNQVNELSLYVNALPKVTGTGTEVTLNDTANCPMPMSLRPSATSQDGTPTPETPQDIHTVSGNNTIIISNSDNTESQTLPLNLGTIELCKIGNYKDYFYKDNDKWYLHKEIGKRVFNGSERWSLSGLSVTGYKGYYISSTFTEYQNGFCNRFTKRPYSDWTGLVADNFFEFANNSLGIRVEEAIASDVQAFKTWLSNNNLFIYGVEKTTPTDTEITDTTLIGELEAIYNKAISYQDQTNITQVNNDLPFVITASAIYDLSNLLN